MLMSPSALPLYNTDKLIYKSGFFNKLRETLPIVSWFLRKEEKGDKRLPGSGRLDKHGRLQLRAAEGSALVPGRRERSSSWLRGRLARSLSKPKDDARVKKEVIHPIPRDQKLTFVVRGGTAVPLLPRPLCPGEADRRWPPGQTGGGGWRVDTQYGVSGFQGSLCLHLPVQGRT